jgi:uncharacterized protein
MALTEINAQALPPGAYAIEKTAGAIPSEIADFSRCYMLVSGSTGNYCQPIQVVDVADAVAKFGVAGQSRDAIDALFLQHRASILYLVRVPIASTYAIEIAVGAAGTYEISVGDVDLTHITSETLHTAIAAELIEAINDEQSPLAQLVVATPTSPASERFNLRALDPLTPIVVTVSSSVAENAIVVANTTGTNPKALDYDYAVTHSFSSDLHPPGFLLCPEAFYSLVSATDRLVVAQAFIDYCTEQDWFALLDPGAPSRISTIQQFVDEGMSYVTPRGHASYTMPYLLNTASAQVAPSPYVAGVAMSRYMREGYRQPPAGSKYPLRGVLKPLFEVRESEHATFNNQHGINVIKTLYGQGIQIRGARTRTTNVFFNTITDRVIFNVLLTTLRRAFKDLIFESVDGQFELFGIIERTGYSLLYRMYQAGVFFGENAQDAFKIICNRSNNPDIDLEAGIVRVDIYAIPSPFAEKLIMNVARVAIGEMEYVGTINVTTRNA